MTSNKRFIANCYHCGLPILKGMRYKIDHNNHRYCYDHNKDCLKDERRAKEVMARMEADMEEVDHVVGRSYE